MYRECPPRYATQRTPSRQTLGTAAARVAESLGTPFMPWQRQVLDTALEIENGMLVYREVIVTVPRQSGKTTSLLSLILTRALSKPRQRIVYTAQTRADARKKWFETWIPVLDGSKFSEYYKARLANGDESLLFSNGSRQGLVASTLKSGHGDTLDMAIIDEAFAQPDARLEQALKPAMVTRNKPPWEDPKDETRAGAQLWVVSTAGTLGSSPYLWSKVEMGREIATSGLNRSVAYFEWSADDDADPTAEETWWSCMPALDRTASVEAVRADFLSMELHEFMRAYLNVWTTLSVDPVIPIARWMELKVDGLDTTGAPVAIALDVTPMRDYASVAASGRLRDGSQFVELIKHAPGVAWVADYVAAVCNANDVTDVLLDPIGPAGALLDDLTKRQVNVKKVDVREMAQACQMFYDAAVEERSIRHTGQSEMTAALDGGAKRPVGDGAWAWGRKNSAVDISPLVASTLAFWSARTGTGEAGALWDLEEIVNVIRSQRQVSEVAASQATLETLTGLSVGAPPPENPGGLFVMPI